MTADIYDFMKYYKIRDGNSKIIITKEDIDYLFNHHLKIDEEHLDWLCFNLSFRRYELFLNSLFKRNHFIEADDMFIVGFVIGYTSEHIAKIESEICKALDKMEKNYSLIDAKDKSIKQISEEITNLYFNNKYEAFDALLEEFNRGGKIYIFKELSHSKIKQSWEYIRDFIKFHEGIRHRNKQYDNFKKPMTDLIFIDYASFLQKGWHRIGYYLSVLSFEDPW